MKLLFVVNPISGGVNKEPFLKEAKNLCTVYGIDYRIFKTTGDNDKENLQHTLQEYSPNKVASVGGDGTTLLTALALLGSDYPMGIIPLGSANGMATELFVNPKPIEALKDLIMSEKVAGLDLIKVNDEFYTTHIGDVGLNAQIVKAYEEDDNRGMITYAKYFLDEMTKLKKFPVHIKANGKIYHENVLMVGICNARKYGTGVPLNNSGNPMDGKYELVLIMDISTNSLLKAGLSKFNEDYFDNQTNKVIVTKYSEIEFDKPRLLQLDGEVIGEFKKLKIEILEGAINLITTAKNLNLH
ncbi:MAG: diacylglycerol/lipid kinase family protein [Flavobacteriaceae bacterium]